MSEQSGKNNTSNNNPGLLKQFGYVNIGSTAGILLILILIITLTDSATIKVLTVLGILLSLLSFGVSIPAALKLPNDAFTVLRQ